MLFLDVGSRTNQKCWISEHWKWKWHYNWWNFNEFHIFKTRPNEPAVPKMLYKSLPLTQIDWTSMAPVKAPLRELLDSVGKHLGQQLRSEIGRSPTKVRGRQLLHHFFHQHPLTIFFPYPSICEPLRWVWEKWDHSLLVAVNLLQSSWITDFATSGLPKRRKIQRSGCATSTLRQPLWMLFEHQLTQGDHLMLCVVQEGPEPKPLNNLTTLCESKLWFWSHLADRTG